MGGLLDDGLHKGSWSNTPPYAADDGHGMAPVLAPRGKRRLPCIRETDVRRACQLPGTDSALWLRGLDRHVREAGTLAEQRMYRKRENSHAEHPNHSGVSRSPQPHDFNRRKRARVRKKRN